MTIQENPMNPVPIWPSKSYWQSQKATFHDAMAWPLSTKGTFPAMQLTLSDDNLPTEQRTVRVFYQDPSDMEEYSGTLNADGSIELRYQFERIVISEGSKDDTYNVLYRNTGEMPAVTYQLYDIRGNKDIPASALAATITLYNEANTFQLTLNSGINMNVSTNLVFHLYKYDNTSVSSDITVGNVVYRVPKRLRTSTRFATIVVDAVQVSGTFDDGVYYMTVKDKDNVTRYSEPFMWLSDTSLFSVATYRRSQPVVTTENYMPFSVNGVAKSLTMYIRGKEIMPPYQFDTEVKEIDGRKYPLKLVSYRKERMSFYCYQAFMEAVRLLWHCDIRTINGHRVDYMEPPEVDWGSDNHLCRVVLEFECDTVVQTNGLASAYGDSSDSEHIAYDASFDASFN